MSEKIERYLVTPLFIQHAEKSGTQISYEPFLDSKLALVYALDREDKVIYVAREVLNDSFVRILRNQDKDGFDYSYLMQIQVYVNGHDWLERKLTANGISFAKHNNVFLRVDDWKRAQKLADRYIGLNWPLKLERYARFVNPLLKSLLHGYQHYWVISQSEYLTDIVFKSSSDLRELFPRLLSHSTLCFGAKDVMSFLGRKLTGHFLGEIISDMKNGGWRKSQPNLESFSFSQIDCQDPSHTEMESDRSWKANHGSILMSQGCCFSGTLS